jgi:hypothetical protein
MLFPHTGGARKARPSLPTGPRAPCVPHHTLVSCFSVSLPPLISHKKSAAGIATIFFQSAERQAMSITTVNQEINAGATESPFQRAHSTPDPEIPPAQPKPNPTPDDVPAPTHAPVEEPTQPEPPIRAA